MLKIVLALILFSSPALALDRYIDEPFTLPVDKHAVAVSLGYLAQRPIEAGTQGLLFNLLAQYRQPLADDLELVWAPLPLGVRYRVRPKPGMERGVAWSVDFYNLRTWGIKPTFTSYTRWEWAADRAIELDVSYYLFVPFNEAAATGSLSLGIAPVLQLSREWAISPRLGISSGDYYLLRFERDAVPAGQATDLSKSRFTLPIGGFVDYRTDSGWESKLSYAYYGLSLDPSDYEHVVTLKLERRF